MTVPLSLAEQVAKKSPDLIRQTISDCSEQEALETLYDWTFWARQNQRPPTGVWFVWMLMSGRGFGKTRTGAEQVRQWVSESTSPIRVALVAETAADARDVCIEGESGILACSPPWNMPVYQPSKRRLVWPNGSMALTFSGEEPDQLRGPQFHKAWVDELAKYQYPDDTWDNLEFTLRLGLHPQAVVTTTPRPIPLIKRLLKDPMVRVTRGSSYQNLSNLAPSYIKRIISKYEGTRLGRQEVHGAVLEDVPGALWSYDLMEQTRLRTLGDTALRRIAVGVDPAVTMTDDSNDTGIVVVGRDKTDGYVLRDASGQFTPDGWARKAVELYHQFNADVLVAEVNQGGDMVEAIVRTIDQKVNYRAVRAAKAKQARAEPVAALYEQGRMHHVGMYAALEDQMCATTVEGYTGEGSPDRMDALVWAVTALMLDDVIVPIVKPTGVPLASPFAV